LFCIHDYFLCYKRVNSLSTAPGFIEGLYTVIRFGLIVGALFGFIFAIILGMLYRPFRSIVFFREEDNFLAALNAAVVRINYKFSKQDNNFYIFREKKNKLADIQVRIDDSKATIYGHFSKVKNLNRYLPGQSPLNLK